MTTTTTTTTMATALLATAVLALATTANAASAPISSPALDDLEITSWQRGRATFYGKDGYSIHDGACHYGGIPYPYHVAALSDWWPEYINSAYEHNKCGHCFEIQCDPNGRGYCRGDQLNTSIIVRVTDRCPCHHENPSNKRWCCGDMPHFDLSHEAFGQLGSHTGGWVYLQWREIQCPDAVGLGGEVLEDPYNWKPYCNADEDKTLADVASEAGLTTFLEAVWRAGPDVWDALTTKAHQHSIVAPTNEGFEAFASSMGLTVEELLDEAMLGEIVKHHFVKSEVDFSSASCTDVQPSSGNTCAQEGEWNKCGSPEFTDNGYCKKTCGACAGLETMSDKPLTVTENGAVIDGSRVTRVIEGCNGNIAVVKDVLYSLCAADSKGVLQVAQEAGLLHFVEAVWKANVMSSGTLKIGNEQGLYTVFAPTDGAFDSYLKKMRFASFADFLRSDRLVDIMANHVLKGHKHVGFFEKQCHDLAVPSEIIDMIPLGSDEGEGKSLDNSTVSCEELEVLGFCSNEWIATGYCRASCGRCKSKGAEQERVFSIASQPLALEQSKMAAEAQLQVFEVAEDMTAPESALKVKITKASGAHKQSTGSVVLVPDIEACNGLVNIVDSVIF